MQHGQHHVDGLPQHGLLGVGLHAAQHGRKHLRTRSVKARTRVCVCVRARACVCACVCVNLDPPTCKEPAGGLAPRCIYLCSLCRSHPKPINGAALKKGAIMTTPPGMPRAALASVGTIYAPWFTERAAMMLPLGVPNAASG
eukprot:1161053-Pelagomonas_calceolata.AAC.22